MLATSGQPAVSRRTALSVAGQRLPYISTWQGWRYAAFVHRCDCQAHRWLASDSSRHTDFVLDALGQSLYARQPDQGSSLIQHSDRRFAIRQHSLHRTLGPGGHRAFGGQQGDSYDNALAETINGLYKAELIHRRSPWKTKEAVEFATLQWVS